MNGTLPDSALIARRFHALSDETRLRVVEVLSRGERCVCELQGALDAAQSRLSFHLRVLKEAGLVSHRKEGRWSYYSLDSRGFDEVSEFLAAVRPGRDAWDDAAGRCT